MELTENDNYQKIGKKCMLCTRNTLLPYEYEWTCTACGYNVIKRKVETTKNNKKE